MSIEVEKKIGVISVLCIEKLPDDYELLADVGKKTTFQINCRM